MVVIPYWQEYTWSYFKIRCNYYSKNFGLISNRSSTSGKKINLNSNRMVGSLLVIIKIKKIEGEGIINYFGKGSLDNEHRASIFRWEYILYLVWNLLPFQLGYHWTSSLFYFIYRSLFGWIDFLQIKKAL